MSDWKPIESAPKDGTEFLAYIPHEFGYDFSKCIWICWADVSFDRFNGWETWAGDCDSYEYFPIRSSVKPTHWMPLPSPPQEPADGPSS